MTAYQSSTAHPRLSVGQRWRCLPPHEDLEVVIVAIDSYPGAGGFAINVLIETGGRGSFLAPIASSSLEPSLDRLLVDAVEVADELDDYASWKEMANQGLAGVWTCGPEHVVSHLSSS